MPKHLVFVGGGHAHLTALLRLRDYVRAGHCVTLIGPSPYQYYLGMGPGLLSGIYRPAEVRFHVRKMAEDRGGAFLEDRVVTVDPGRRSPFLGSGGRPAARPAPAGDVAEERAGGSPASPSCPGPSCWRITLRRRGLWRLPPLPVGGSKRPAPRTVRGRGLHLARGNPAGPGRSLCRPAEQHPP